jgi:hypothetical protein
MKSHYFPIMAAAGFALALVTACPAQSTPAASAQPPPPARTSPPRSPVVPRRYVWDGFEFVGRGGNQYFYLGPNNVWMVMDNARLRRFQEFQIANPNWQQNQIRNTRYFLIQH